MKRLISSLGIMALVTAAMATSALAHPQVTLYAKDGSPITTADMNAGAPVSTQATCFTGSCHGGSTGYTERSGAFHVQQGANEYNKASDDGNDYVVAGRPFVNSPGMFGKW